MPAKANLLFLLRNFSHLVTFTEKEKRHEDAHYWETTTLSPPMFPENHGCFPNLFKQILDLD